MFRNFLDEGSGRVAYLEGVEYLVRIHGPEKTLGLLRELDGLARSTQARLFVPVNPALMDPAGADRLLGEFGAGRPGDGGVTPVGA